MDILPEEREEEGGPSPAINITPLIDVLLVLLVMVIITVPAPRHLVELGLGQGGVPPRPDPAGITLSLAADGRMGWNGEALADRADLSRRLAALAPESEVRLDASPDAAWGAAAGIMAEVRRQGGLRFSIVRR